MTGLMARPSRRSDWAYFAGICLFAVLLRLPIAAIPFERDEGSQAYIAQRWIEGDIPYRDDFEKKPPAIYVVYASVERVIGTRFSAIHWGMQLYTLGTLALIFLLGRRLSSSTAGLAAAAFAAFMTADPSVRGNAANAEVFMILPLTAAMLASCYAVERASLTWAFITGVCAGLALVFKQVALSNVVFYALFVTWMLQRRRLVAPALLLGLLTIPVLAGAYFALHGAWEAFVDATIGHGFAYANRTSLTQNSVSLGMTLRDIVRSFWPLLLLAAVPVAGGLFGAVLGPGRLAPARIRRNTMFALIWLGASFIGTASGGSFQADCFVQLLPPLALLAGMAVNRITRQSRNPSFRPLIAAGLVIVPIAIGVLSNLWYYSPGDAGAKSVRLYGGPLFAESLGVGAFIAGHSNPQDSVFVLGSEPQILAYAARRSATRYIFLYPLMGPFRGARHGQAADDAQLRNGARAVQLAEGAAQRTERRNANVLNSLAAAYAEVGRYTDAAAVAAQAIEIASGSDQAALRDALAARLAEYRAGHPVRDHPGAPQP